MRVFLAVPIDRTLRGRLWRLIGWLRRSGADCKWVRAENLHLTLSFLGELSKERISAAEAAMARAVSGRPAFEVSFDRIGAFPGLNAPRILWVGIDQGTDSLEGLVAALRGELKSEGLREPGQEREFKAHLTLGRLRSRRNLGRLQKSFEAASERFQEPWKTRLDRVLLMESRLSREGPIYEVLKEARLEEG